MCVTGCRADLNYTEECSNSPDLPVALLPNSGPRSDGASTACPAADASQTPHPLEWMTSRCLDCFIPLTETTMGNMESFCPPSIKARVLL